MSLTSLFASRATHHVHAKRLFFDCYRIRRRWSVELPLMALPMLDLQIRGFSKSYPYQIWCLWALEERINALNNAVIWLEDTTARDQNY